MPNLIVQMARDDCKLEGISGDKGYFLNVFYQVI